MTAKLQKHSWRSKYRNLFKREKTAQALPVFHAITSLGDLDMIVVLPAAPNAPLHKP